MKYPYEVLLRLSASGVVGAHVVFAADVENPLTGELQTQIGNAEPLAVADGQAGLALSDVLGGAAALALLEREAALGEKAAAQQALQAMTAERDATQANVAALTAQLSQLQALIAAAGGAQ